jgi:serine/threonine-protein kinase
VQESVQRGARGEYRIYAEIGAGGMASVHLGRFLGTVGFARTVAIKRPLPNLQQNHDFRRLATREALLAARVQHPNVVTTLDVVDSGRELLIVMEYVHGTTLSTLVSLARERGERVPLEIAVALVGSVLRGLSAVHQARSERGDLLGLVHRDVSPQNILCGVDGVARLADFGLARASGDVGLSNSDEFKGKLTYAAPEQVELRPLTYAADLYAVGVVLWELLTGERMYRNRTAAELIAQLLHGELAAPSSLVRCLPPALDAVVLRALSRDPSARHESALVMATALEAVVAPARVEATADWICQLAAEALQARQRLVSEAESETTPSQRHPDQLAPALEPTVLAAPEGNRLRRDRVRFVASKHAELRHGFVRAFALAAGVALVWLLGERLWPHAQPKPGETRAEQVMGASSFMAGSRASTEPRPVGTVSAPAYTAPDAEAGGAQRPLALEREPAPRRDPVPSVAERLRNAVRAAAAKGATRAGGGKAGSALRDCSPPYSLDAEGIRHMKPGCK